MTIEPYDPSRLDEVIRLSLRAWEPVFRSIEAAMDPEVFGHFHPDWRVSQERAVAAACGDEATEVWVATEDGSTVGFVALKLDADSGLGEIHMIAVDPDHQRRGVAARLTTHALDRLREGGMSVAMVETGGDPGHAPARAAYESLGFRPFPSVRYFLKL